MSDDLRDPLADKTGNLAELLAELDNDALDEYEAYWESRKLALHAGGDGYGSWWSSKHVSAAWAERRRRAAAASAGE